MADRTRRKPAANPPITSHPLFPATVILWFGALFGLASVAIRPALIEHVVLVTGIDRVIPMAAPPLGTTTRILLALMMTALGCLVGAVVARAVAKPKPQVSTRRRRPEPDGESPVTMFGSGDESHADATEALPTRRRQLTASAKSEPDPIEDEAPLPGAPPILDVAELGLESFDADLEEGPWMRRPAEPEPESETATEQTVLPADEPPAERVVFGRRASFEEQDTAEEPKRANRLFDAYVRPSAPATSEDVPSPGFELLPMPIEEAEPFVSAPAAEIEQPAKIEETPVSAEQDAPIAKTAAERIASAPLDELSPVELLERLALTIARRRAAARQPSPEQTQPAASAPFSQVVPQDALPVALRPVPLDDRSDEEDALPGYVPPRHISLAVPPPNRDQAAEDDGALAMGYASLCDLTKGPRPEFGRKDDTAPPVVSFPATIEPAAADQHQQPTRAFDGPASHGADRTEQALRDALATLQRMSGAA